MGRGRRRGAAAARDLAPGDEARGQTDGRGDHYPFPELLRSEAIGPGDPRADGPHREALELGGEAFRRTASEACDRLRAGWGYRGRLPRRAHDRPRPAVAP